MKLKRILACLVLGLFLCSLNSAALDNSIVYAASAAEAGVSAQSSAAVSPRAEETEWKYRVVDGKLQKRLWSNTYNKWLTDWEWV